MPYIEYKCRFCNKKVTEVSNFKVKGKIARKLSCGHTQIDDIVIEQPKESYESLVSLLGKKLFPFQLTGAREAEKSNLNFLFADEMGLGKTVQILAALKVQRESALPCAVICKSSLKSQWSVAIAEWFGNETIRIQIESSKDLIPPNQPFYIFSFDILRRFAKKVKERNLQGELIETLDFTPLQKMFEFCGIKTLVIDECQYIKNHESTRYRAMKAIAPLTKYKLAASGTPIENHAGEYFPILNILKPELFRSQSGFITDWCDNYWTGYSYKVAGIKNIKKFNEFTKDFIIRRVRSEVELEFPEVNRQYHYYDLGEQVQKAYDASVDELADVVENSHGHFEEATNTLAILNRMRHLTGLSKVQDTVDFVDEFITSTDRKIVIFVHHIDVGDLIEQKCKALINNINEMFGKHYSAPYRMLGGQAEKTYELGETFQDDKNSRILIAPTRAAGEGLNLQREIGDCIAVEREWNPSKEDQAFVGRFTRIGSKFKTTNVNYMLAIGTVDEDFTKIVERKRAILSNTLDGKVYSWNESDLMKELTSEILKSRNKRRT